MADPVLETPPNPTLEEIWPPYGVTVTASDLELRVVRESDVPKLVALVQSGVHAPDRMPFSFPWTAAPAADLPTDYFRYVARTKASLTPDHWSLQFAVRRDGELLGTQGLDADDFGVTRTAETGSWLAMRHQGRGVGTRMRQAVCAFAFDVLGAAEVTSGAFLDNPASLAVSRKVGYRPDGVRRLARQGSVALNQRLVLTAEDLVRGEPIEVVGAEPLLTFLGLTPSAA